MKKIQVWITAFLFCISFFSTVVADEGEVQVDEKKIESNLSSIRAWLKKAGFYLRQWKEDKALKEVQKVLEKDPENEQALALKTEIIWESAPVLENKDDNVFSEESLMWEEKAAADKQVDYMKLVEENWLILAILWGSFIALVIIFIMSRINKNKQKNNENQDKNSENNEEKDVFAELEDVF